MAEMYNNFYLKAGSTQLGLEVASKQSGRYILQWILYVKYYFIRIYEKGIPCNFTGFLENRPIHESKKEVLALKLVKSQNRQVDHINMADSFNHTA